MDKLLAIAPTGFKNRVAYICVAALVSSFLSHLAAVALYSIGLARPQPLPLNAIGIAALSVGVVFAPVMETLLMMSVMVLLMRIGSRRWGLVVISAGIWALLHSLEPNLNRLWSLGANQIRPYEPNGVRGFVVFVPFLVFSISLTAYRTKSLLDSFLMTATIHSLSNALAFGLLYAGM